MPENVIQILGAVSDLLGPVMPLATVGLLAYFGFLFVVGALLIREGVRSLRSGDVDLSDIPAEHRDWIAGMYRGDK